MQSTLKKHGAPIISIITAIATVISALVWKGTEYENTWLYVFCTGLIVSAIFEVYSSRK